MLLVLAAPADAIIDSWFIGVMLRRRTCNGDCSYEPFIFERILDTHQAASRLPSDRVQNRLRRGSELNVIRALPLTLHLSLASRIRSPCVQ